MRDVDNNELDPLDFWEWVEYGVKNKWIEKPVCYNHDILPTTTAEDEDMEEGGDPCIQVIRVWDF